MRPDSQNTYIFLNYWNRGYTSEALGAVLKFAFKENDILKVETGCLTENLYSEKIMMKFGFKREAYKPNHQWIAGQLQDRVEYGLFRKTGFNKKENKRSNQ